MFTTLFSFVLMWSTDSPTKGVYANIKIIHIDYFKHIP